MLPTSATMMDGTIGRSNPTAYGMAPRSSISGTMEMRNTIRYFFIGFPINYLFDNYDFISGSGLS